jgi:hypothetical protein
VKCDEGTSPRLTQKLIELYRRKTVEILFSGSLSRDTLFFLNIHFYFRFDRFVLFLYHLRSSCYQHHRANETARKSEKECLVSFWEEKPTHYWMKIMGHRARVFQGARKVSTINHTSYAESENTKFMMIISNVFPYCLRIFEKTNKYKHFYQILLKSKVGAPTQHPTRRSSSIFCPFVHAANRCDYLSPAHKWSPTRQSNYWIINLDLCANWIHAHI